MPFTLEEFCRLRPHLYHLTAKENLPRILENRRLLSAEALCEDAGRKEILQARRSNHVTLQIGNAQVQIRDQAPLHERNMLLEDGWSFKDLLSSLNGRVFFWPGTRAGSPIPSGIRHFERYSAEKPVIIRVRSNELFDLNAKVEPDFAKFNSGSPRWTNGLPSPRGPSTFVKCGSAAFSAASAIECTYRNFVLLPKNIEIREKQIRSWRLV